MDPGNDKQTKFYENLNMQSGMTKMSPARGDMSGKYCLKHIFYIPLTYNQ